MDRFDIIEKLGRKYFDSNLEKGEFSYQQALQKKGKNIDKYFESGEKQHKYLDIRFADNQVSVLVETKNNFDSWNKSEIYKQLQDYVRLEKEYTGNKIVAIIANTKDDRILVRYGEEIDDENVIKNEKLKTFEEYKNYYFGTKNDKQKVIKSTYELNELLHEYGIKENIRSQFVGTCLLALKEGLVYENLPTKSIIGGIQDILSRLLNDDLRKAEKLTILNNKVIESQDIKVLKKEEFQHILNKINDEIRPYIDDKSTAGQDLLNLFFTTFNKYVGKADKNQAFTPDHIVHFMCKVIGINRNSRVLDPCCGSGAFLVRAMVEAMNDCDTEKERDNVKKKQIYGIEYEESAFGLSTTNMLIHGDGNTNIVQGSCFDKTEFIEDAKIDRVLMNPPYNAQKKHCKPEYVATWKGNTKEDPSKGLHYVYEIASKVKTGKLAVLLPMACAIGSSNDIKTFKEKMLNEHTLDAVFSLPNETFYPGASVVPCCMIFTLGTRHVNSPVKGTFFGYFKDDGFTKKKNLGRVEKLNENGVGMWGEIEKERLNLYYNRITKPGISVVKEVSADDERLAEAYMETDYSKVSINNFEITRNSYLSYLVSSGMWNDFENFIIESKNITGSFEFNVTKWKEFRLGDIFKQERGKESAPNQNLEGETPIVNETDNNNGITRNVEPTKIFKGNAITISINVGYNVFYQPYDFCASVNISILKSKYLNKYNGLFIVTLIKENNKRYSYGYKTSKDKIDNMSIKLPIDSSGNPDREFMENYIKSLPYGDRI